MVTKAIKASAKLEKKWNLLSAFFHSCYLINHCQRCQIWKRSTKGLKNRYAATLIYLIFGHLARKLMFLGVAPTILTFLGMFPVKSVCPLILKRKRAFELWMINWLHNVILIEFIWLKTPFQICIWKWRSRKT